MESPAAGWIELFAGCFQLLVPLILLALGFFVGRSRERSHYRSIHEREQRWASVPALANKTIVDPRPVAQARLVAGECVISVDYWKRLASILRSFVGGEVRSYSSLLDRARREATLRMKMQAPSAHAFYNVRLETMSITSGRNQKTIAAVEVLAYATAVRFLE